MGDNHGLTKENLLRSLPVSLAGDSKMLAMAEAMALSAAGDCVVPPVAPPPRQSRTGSARQ